jgi:hypothetical protein
VTACKARLPACQVVFANQQLNRQEPALFLLHLLPDGFQRIRHYGFLANGNRQAKLTRIRQLLPAGTQPQQQIVPATQESATPPPEPEACTAEDEWQPTCPGCGAAMHIVEALPKVAAVRSPGIDTS